MKAPGWLCVQAGLHGVGHQRLPEGQREFPEEGQQDCLEKGHWDLSEEGQQSRQPSTAHLGGACDTFGSSAAMWTSKQGAGYPQGQSLGWRQGCTFCEFGHMAALDEFVFSRSCPNKLQGAVNLLAQVKDVLFST